ncbi:ATP-dependent RNA helicase DEAH11, chloroplastic-like [Bidens hawaiensis]|uniref:ATP-dependent RNA helicase DEAH11, chloroplastic-like n=1 Tax=Bidens hawaiensis TaxID=980011 RepID=UPI00404A1DE5
MTTDQTLATMHRNKPPIPSNHRSFGHPNHHRRRDRSPSPLSAARRRPNFIIELRSTSTDQNTYNRHEIVSLMGKFKFAPDDFFLYQTGIVAARFFYQQWSGVLNTVVYLWEVLLDGGLSFMPRLVQNVLVPSDTEELNSRLRVLFTSRILGFLAGETVRKLEDKLDEVSREISRIELLLKKPKRLAVHVQLSNQKEGMVREKELIGKRVDEFNSAMQCVLDYLDGKVCDGESEVKVLMLNGALNWSKVYWMIKRELKRLEEGLPIYADRKDILWKIHCQQVMVLIGETGSGKSTQLVQFLIDSGVAGDKSIVCTQPRKLAAISLANRVKEESRGCCDDNSIVCSSAFSSVNRLDSKAIFMTDHCLLQHYMNDKNFSWASCIIVDEAHERSLSTDLLLALIKDLLHRRSDLRFIIMSATADADQLAKYFFDCDTHHVLGRTFPVDIRYVPEMTSSSNVTFDFMPSYVSHVLRRVGEIHKNEEHGAILAFLTSQMEVEWACHQFKSPSAICLPLHGKLSHEEQYRVYLNYPKKRKVIFSTNLAETSLTIPGVKYVVDSGMVKESRFEPGTGMNVLKVCRISQSSANQRAGRAGRTEPGKCYRVYEEREFQSMPCHQEPEIRRVNLGIAVLRILALGIHKVEEFDFIDAPSNASIETAIKSLIQLGAVVLEHGIHKLTKDGRMLVKLGIEPKLGKVILKCFENRMGREGLVLAAVMANSSSIFCRVGREEEKHKSDRLKVQFCHPGGDLFTLLSVYRKWELVPRDKRNQWCWDNSINAKSMRRCQEAVQEMESCLQHELNIIIPTYWRWDPMVITDSDQVLKDVILSALADNIAMYSGNDNLGYEVPSSGTHFQLHPSCSLLMFGERPSWVVFGEIIAMPHQYLVCVTSVDFNSLLNLSPAPFDIAQIDRRKLQLNVLTGFGATLLKRFCGKSNLRLKRLVASIKDTINDDRVRLEVSVDHNEVNVFATSEHMTRVCEIVKSVLEREEKWLENECIEKCLFPDRHVLPPVALFGSGAEIKHLELDKRCLTVDIFVHGSDIEEKELLSFLEEHTCGNICAVHKLNLVGQDNEKWGRVMFFTPEAAEKAIKLTPVDFNGCKIKVAPSRSIFGGDNKLSFPAVKAKVSWPRKQNRGFAFVHCNPEDVSALVEDFSHMFIRDQFINCRPSMKFNDSVMVSGFAADVFEPELYDSLYNSTNRKILKVSLPRAPPAENPPVAALEDALLREVRSFMPGSKNECVRVHIFPCEPLDYVMKAEISFDGSLHLEAAKALEQIDGKALPGCQPWQKIKCQQQFNSIVSCPASVYGVIKDQLRSLLDNLQLRKGAEFFTDWNENGTYRVRISAKATKIMAESRRPLEQLMNGRTIIDDQLTPPVIQLIFSREGFGLQKSIQRETGTFFLFDRHNQSFRVFGPLHKLDLAQNKLVQSLVALHENKQLDVHLRGPTFPPDFMKKVVENFGPDLHGLKERFPGSDLTLNTRHHIISVCGSKELKQNVEQTINEILHSTDSTSGQSQTIEKQTRSCPICLCDVEDGYRLERCNHEFCRSCLVEQFESAIKNSGNSFPIRCAHEGCEKLILVVDIKALLLNDKIDELFRASLGSFVGSSSGKYRFCPSPDCPSVYQVSDVARPFTCGACSVETCTQCHLEYHALVTCERYMEFKRDPDSSLKEWMKGKEEVRNCPVCMFTIEKIDGCNHIECRCGSHICWVCLENFKSSDECYGHLRSIHHAIV